MNDRGDAPLPLLAAIGIAGVGAVTAAALQQPGAGPLSAPNVIESALQLIAFLGAGKWVVSKVERQGERYAADREADARLDAAARAEVKIELIAVEKRVVEMAEKDLDVLRSDLNKLDATVRSLTEAFVGNPLTGGGLRAATMENQTRRHDIMNNLSVMDAKQVVVVAVMLKLAKALNVEVDPHEADALRKPIRWRRMEGDEA